MNKTNRQGDISYSLLEINSIFWKLSEHLSQQISASLFALQW